MRGCTDCRAWPPARQSLIAAGRKELTVEELYTLSAGRWGIAISRSSRGLSNTNRVPGTP